MKGRGSKRGGGCGRGSGVGCEDGGLLGVGSCLSSRIRLVGDGDLDGWMSVSYYGVHMGY